MKKGVDHDSECHSDIRGRELESGNSVCAGRLRRMEKDALDNAGAKQENVRFYTEKCGFQIASTERDGKVELVRFLPERLLESSQASVKGTGEHERLQFVF